MPDKKEWKLKKDENGVEVFTDDKPVYIDPDGKELPLDPVHMYTKIIDLGKESKEHREAAKAVSEQLKIFEGIDDLPDWKKQADEAMEKIQNFNDKDWLKAEKVEKLKEDMASSYTEKLSNAQKGFDLKESEYKDAISTKDAQMRKLMITNLFSTSPYFSGTNPKTNLPPAIAETYFGKNFKDQLLKGSSGGSGSGGGQGGDDDSPGTQLANLEKQYAEATAAHDGRKAIALKGQIHELRRRQAA